jgi:hypothetical protein
MIVPRYIGRNAQDGWRPLNMKRERKDGVLTIFVYLMKGLKRSSRGGERTITTFLLYFIIYG